MNNASAGNLPPSPNNRNIGKIISDAVPKTAAVSGETNHTLNSFLNNINVPSHDINFNQPERKKILNI